MYRKQPTEKDRKRVYLATYSAYFALQVHEYVLRGGTAPGSEDYARFAEEAEDVARDAVVALIGYEPED